MNVVISGLFRQGKAAAFLTKQERPFKLTKMSRFQDIVGSALRYWLPNEEYLENYRPEWLFGMEIDFYFPDLGLAVEVNGRQHYDRVSFQTGIEHDRQRRRDAKKKRIILSRGLKFIIVRQRRGMVIGGLQGLLRFRLGYTGRKFGPLPRELSKTWKEHSKKMNLMFIAPQLARAKARRDRKNKRKYGYH